MSKWASWRRLGRRAGTAGRIAGAMVVAVLAAAACSNPPDRSDGPVGEATPSASSAPAASSAPWDLGRVVELDEDSRPPAFYGVEWHDGPGWIAYGTDRSTDASLPGIWTSVDGLAWAPAELPDGLGPEESDLADVAVYDVARADFGGQDRFVAVVSGYGAIDGYVPPRIVVSDDGTSWEAATTPNTATEIYHVAYGPVGFIAIGQEQEAGRIWRSSDGLEWAEAASDGLEQAAHPVSFEVVANRYVVTGYPSLSGAPAPLLTWTSADGATWSEGKIDPSSAGCVLDDESDFSCLRVTADASAGRIAILGLFTRESPFVAISADGAAWTIEPVDDRFAVITDVDVIGDGSIVAVGAQPRADLEPDAYIWVRSADTTEWRSVDWRAMAPAAREIDRRELRGSVHVAVGPDRTLILFDYGSVLLTSDRLP